MNTSSIATPLDLLLTGLVTGAGHSYTSLTPDELIAHVTVQWSGEEWEGVEFAYAAIYGIMPSHILIDTPFAAQAEGTYTALLEELSNLFGNADTLVRLGLGNVPSDATAQVRVLRVWNYDRTEHWTPTTPTPDAPGN
jgi:hypothetical protein